MTDKSVKRLDTKLIHVLLQIESKISARRLNDFHPNWGQVEYCTLKVHLANVSLTQSLNNLVSQPVDRFYILQMEIYLFLSALMRSEWWEGRGLIYVSITILKGKTSDNWVRL